MKDIFIDNEFSLSLSDGEKSYYAACLADREGKKNELDEEYGRLLISGTRIDDALHTAMLRHNECIKNICLSIKDFCDAFTIPGQNSVAWAYTPSDAQKKKLLKRYYEHIEELQTLVNIAAEQLGRVCSLESEVEAYNYDTVRFEKSLYLYNMAQADNVSFDTERPSPASILERISEFCGSAYTGEALVGEYSSLIDAAFDAVNKGQKMDLSRAKSICLKTFSALSRM